MHRFGRSSRSRRLVAILLAGAILLPTAGMAGARSAGGPAGSASAVAALLDDAGLVTRDGSDLELDGRPFRFTGMNVYNANSDGWCGAELRSGPALDRALTELGDGHEVVRAWFFQTLATDKGTRTRDWRAFDHTLDTLADHGLRAVVTLTDQWGECGTDTPGNGFKTAEWYRTGYLAPQPGLPVSYRDWVAEVVTRYAGDPRIAFWQLINEAEVRETEASACPSGDLTPFETLHAWAADVSGLIKALDPAHLVSLGTIGSGQCGTDGPRYEQLHAIPTIDLCEFHDYGSPTVGIPGDAFNGLQVRIDQCQALDKPIFVGEAGIKPDELDGTLLARSDAFQAKIAAQFAAGVRGFLAWAWSPQTVPVSTLDNYDLGPADPAFDGLRGPSLAVVTPEWTEVISIRQDGGATTGTTSLISGVTDRSGRAISSGGTRVTFWTEDSGMVPGGTNGWPQVYVRDRSTGETIVISRDFGLGATISADGRSVAYSGGTDRNIRVADVDTGESWLVSHTPAGQAGNDTSDGALIGADGRHVVFHSWASDLVTDDTNGRIDVFAWDRDTDMVQLVSVDAGGDPANGDSFSAATSDDGRLVAFRSTASDLVAGDTNGVDDIFVRDLVAGTTTRVSVASDGTQGDARSIAPAISHGHLVAFASEATNLAPGTEEGVNVFVHDLVSGTTRYIAGPGATMPALSDDERYLSAYVWPAYAVIDLEQGAIRSVPMTDRGFGVDPDGRFLAVAGGETAWLTDFAAPPDDTGPTTAVFTTSPDLVATGDRPRLTGQARDIGGRGVDLVETFVGSDPGTGSGDPATTTGVEPVRIDTFLPPMVAGDHDVSVRARDRAGNWGLPVSVPIQVSPPGGEERVSVTASAEVGGGNATTDADGSGPTPDDPVESGVGTRWSGVLSIHERDIAASDPVGVRLIGQEVAIVGPEPGIGGSVGGSFTLDSSLFPPDQDVGDVKVYRNGTPVPACAPSFPPTANPDPCIGFRSTTPDGDASIAYRTFHLTGVITFGLPAAVAVVPGAPTGVIAAAGDGEASVSWSAPASDGGSAISGYIVRASTGQSRSVGGAVNATTVPGLANGAAVSFTVAAINGAGTGPDSAPSAAVTPTAGAQGAVAIVPPGAGATVSTHQPAGVTPADPFSTSVFTPVTEAGGSVTVAEGAAVGPGPGGGYEVLGQSVVISSSVPTSATNPLTVQFMLDESIIRAALALGPGDPMPDPAAVDITRAVGEGTPGVVPACTNVGGGGAPIAPTPTCVSERVYLGTDLRLTVLTEAASTWGAVVHPLRLTLTDKTVSPSNVDLPVGGVAIWTFTGSKPHTVTERDGLGPAKAPLFTSPAMTTGAYGHAFEVAGTYGFASTVKKDPDGLAGTIGVVPTVSPASGSTATSFTVRWATRMPVGSTVEVRYRSLAPGARKWSGWTTWRAATTDLHGVLVPTNGRGTYVFEVRLRNTASGRLSGWSPQATMLVE